MVFNLFSLLHSSPKGCCRSLSGPTFGRPYYREKSIKIIKNIIKKQLFSSKLRHQKSRKIIKKHQKTCKKQPFFAIKGELVVIFHFFEFHVFSEFYLPQPKGLGCMQNHKRDSLRLSRENTKISSSKSSWVLILISKSHGRSTNEQIYWYIPTPPVGRGVRGISRPSPRGLA